MNDQQNHNHYVSSLQEEELLLQQMAAGNTEAFNTLYKYFQPKIQLYILPFTQNTGIEADEIVQDIFVKMWFKRIIFSGIISLEHYLYRMARNRLIDLKRSRDIRNQHTESFQSQNSLNVNATTEAVQFREFKSILISAINELPERRRKIFELSVDKDLSVPEIAGVLQLSKAVVKKQLYLATAYVRDILQKNALQLFPFWLIVHSW